MSRFLHRTPYAARRKMVKTGATATGWFFRSRSATASIEFCILAPVMGIFLMATVDLSEAIIKYQLLNSTVQQAGLMASQLSIQPHQLSSLTVAQVNEASSVIFAIFPGLANNPTYDAKNNPTPPYAVAISNISFTTTQTGCTTRSGLHVLHRGRDLEHPSPLRSAVLSPLRPHRPGRSGRSGLDERSPVESSHLRRDQRTDICARGGRYVSIHALLRPFHRPDHHAPERLFQPTFVHRRRHVARRHPPGRLLYANVLVMHILSR